MTLFIFNLTLRQLLGRKSTLIPVALAAIPVLLAVIFRLSNPTVDPEQWTVVLLFGLVTTGTLPLTALLLGASVLGDELEEGTAVYLLTKPLRRWQILAGKLAAASLITAVLAEASMLASGFIALEGQASLRPLTGFTVAIVTGALSYTAVFILVSLITTRALIAGLVYVFVWETTVPALFHGARYLSIHHYILALAQWVSDIDTSMINEKIDGPVALALVAITTAVAVVFANRRLRQIEIRETT